MRWLWRLVRAWFREPYSYSHRQKLAAWSGGIEQYRRTQAVPPKQFKPVLRWRRKAS